MGKGNHSTMTEFILVGFSDVPELEYLLFSVFLCIFIISLFAHMFLIVLYRFSTHLCTPMYFFLANFSFLEICYISTISPKTLVNLLSNDKTITLYACALQMFCFLLLGSAECYMLAAMAYDRFIAICQPLLYNIIMSRDVSCIQLVGGSWLIGALNAVIHTCLTFMLPFCGSNINHFYCDIPPLLKLACVDTKINEITMFIISGGVIIGSFILTMVSYVKIISTILKIKSVTGRKKAFSTCTSHLIAVSVFYGSIFSVYFKPKSKYEIEQDRVVSIMYTAVAPLLNPFIYSIRNKEMKGALQKLLHAVPKKC
ncbi:Olfactory receptor [Pristimantis euphronides]